MSLRNTTSSAVAEALHDEIRRGVLTPGTRLRQEEIAARLDVSTTPVREAFHVLRGQGLLTLDPHRGVVVFRPTGKDVEESYEIRETLEALAIAKAIPNLTPDLIDQLQSILDEMKDTDDEQRWIELNTLFHYSLYEYSGQKKLCDMIENLRIATNTYVHIIVRNARESGRADSGHQDILDACRERDVARAQEAVRTHLNNTVRHTVELIENLPSGESE